MQYSENPSHHSKEKQGDENQQLYQTAEVELVAAQAVIEEVMVELVAVKTAIEEVQVELVAVKTAIKEVEKTQAKVKADHPIGTATPQARKQVRTTER